MINNGFIKLLSGLVVDVIKFNYPTDKLLSNFFRNNKKIGSNERALIAETVYAILRNYYKLTAVVENPRNPLMLIALTWERVLKVDTDMVRSITVLKDVNASCSAFKNDIKSITEFPDWIIELLKPSFTEEQVISLAQYFQEQAPLDLRVNIVKKDVDSVFSILKNEGLNPQRTAYSPFAIRLMNKSFLAKHKLFLDGIIEVQDESSQLAGMLLNPKRGEMAVDFCAGSGGKTLLLGMMMRNTGRIYAFDVNEKRLNNMAPRLARSGLSNVYPQLISNENDVKVKRLHGKVDKVFIDAPCSGLGTLRRNPELKFRQHPESIVELNAIQLSILNSASKLLKIGGVMVYATCSILKEENQDIVNQFLRLNHDFIIVDASNTLNMPELKRDDGCLVLSPHIHKTDGFFAVLLKKLDIVPKK